MNKVILIGNLTKDPEIRSTSTGKKVASFSLAINEGKSQTGQPLVSYFNCSAWDKKAEILEMYVKKGHKVCITGRLTINSWTKQDGTKVSSPEIVVSDLELLTSRMEADRINNLTGSSNENSNSNNTQKTPPSTNNEAETIENKEVPEIDVNNMDFNVQMPF